MMMMMMMMMMEMMMMMMMMMMKYISTQVVMDCIYRKMDAALMFEELVQLVFMKMVSTFAEVLVSTM